MNDLSEGSPPKYSAWWVFGGMLLLGGILGHPFAGSWNDGSRLASIESVAERGTFIIDDSLFVFPNGPKGLPNPYDPKNEILAKRGTLDLMQIEGHFYSDKSPLPTLVLAWVWQGFRQLGAPNPQADPLFFCRVMNFLAGALPLALGAAAVWILSWRLAGQPKQAVWLFIAGVFSGLPVAYSRFANNHIVVWAAVAWLFLMLDGLSRGSRQSFFGNHVFAGVCLGVSYATDSGLGPGLFVATLVWTIQNPKDLVKRWVSLFLGAIPFLFSHHLLGYHIAGTLGPMNANPAFFQWPGCPFTPESLTGGFKHPHLGKFCLYCGDMLFGKKGFVFHTGVGLLGFLMLFRLLRAKTFNLPKGMSLTAGVTVVLGVLVYALGSNNQSGLCRSVRWFVPLGIPLWYVCAPMVLAGGWKYHVFVWSTAVGLWVAAWGAWFGPWNGIVLPGYWVAVVILVGLGVFSLGQEFKESRLNPIDSESKPS